MATFPEGTKQRLFTVLQCPPEELLPSSRLECQMTYVESLEASGATGLIDIIVEALDELSFIEADILAKDQSGEGTRTSISIPNQISKSYRAGVAGDTVQYLRNLRTTKIALIERTLDYTANSQGDFTYA